MKLEKFYYVYIATNKNNNVLYTGVSSNLLDRSNKHKNKFYKNSFTDKYNINKLVYYEIYSDVYMALGREKQIKNLVRRKKIELIKTSNPDWQDLFFNLIKE